MNVLVVKPHLPLPATQGTRRLTLDLLDDLAAAGRVSLLCLLESPDETRHVQELAARGITVRASLMPNRRSLAHRALFRVRNDGAALLSGFPRDYFYSTPHELERALAEWTEESRFDVVVLEYWTLTPLARHVRSGRPVVLAHDAEFVVRRRRRSATREGRRPIRAWRLAREARREIETLRRAETILALTARDREDLLEALGPDYGGEIHVLPVGTRVRAVSGVSPAPDTVGFVGSFKAEFNVDALDHFLECVWPEVRRRRPSARFLVAGGDPPPALAARDGSDGVSFLGFVEDLETFISGVRAFAVPLRFGGGLRIRLLEALTVGAAVVSTPVGSAGLDLTDGTDHIEAPDDQSFADALVEIISDDALRERLVTGGRATASGRFDADGVRRRRTELFELLAGARTAA